jgi:hypothetical protein
LFHAGEPIRRFIGKKINTKDTKSTKVQKGENKEDKRRKKPAKDKKQRKDPGGADSGKAGGKVGEAGIFHSIMHRRTAVYHRQRGLSKLHDPFIIAEGILLKGWIKKWKNKKRFGKEKPGHAGRASFSR